MYVTHKSEDHTTWREKKSKRKGKKNDSKNPVGATLQLNDKLKAALVTKF